MNDVKILEANGVDLEKSLDLLEDMGTYDEIMSEFLKNASGKLEELQRFFAAGDLEGYGRSAHSLKSDARYLGFTHLAEMALQHEMESKDGDADFIREHLNEIVSETNRMIEVGRQYLVNAPKEDEEVDNTPKEATILVVDDSDLIRSFITSIFKDEFDVVVAGDGQEAISMVNNDTSNKIKGIFLDLNMPNVDGFGVLEYFKQNNLFSRYPVSIITGADDTEAISRAFQYSIVDMLQKPFTEKDVKRIVERTVSRSAN